MPLKIDKRHGFGMIGIFVAILAVGLLMVSITRLLMSMSQGIGNLSERLEMQSIIQDQWKQMNAGTYEDFEDIVAAKGSPWTQSFGAKYEMKVEFGGKGKYVDAACDSSGSVAETDRQCRKVTITIVSKALPDVMESLRMTRVSEPDEKELLKKIEDKIAENGNKFNTLYTKTESDARYIRYGMGDFACPWDFKKAASGVGCEACPAPANDMQYRSGNCQLSTCPSGQVANADQNGCVARVCPHATMLNAAGTACETCTGIPEDSWKQYYGASCSIQTCPTGQMVNEDGNGCMDIVCPTGFILVGDNCKCPSGQIYEESSDSCKTCSSGYKPNADQTACERITCPEGERLVGNKCEVIKVCAEQQSPDFSNGEADYHFEEINPGIFRLYLEDATSFWYIDIPKSIVSQNTLRYGHYGSKATLLGPVTIQTGANREMGAHTITKIEKGDWFNFDASKYKSGYVNICYPKASS